MRIDKYDISADGLNFILSDVKINDVIDDKGVKSKNFGKEMLVNKRFYTSVDGLLRSIAKNELMTSMNEFPGFKSVLDAFVFNLSFIEAEIIKAVKESKWVN